MQDCAADDAGSGRGADVERYAAEEDVPFGLDGGSVAGFGDCEFGARGGVRYRTGGGVPIGGVGALGEVVGVRAR